MSGPALSPDLGDAYCDVYRECRPSNGHRVHDADGGRGHEAIFCGGNGRDEYVRRLREAEGGQAAQSARREREAA